MVSRLKGEIDTALDQFEDLIDQSVYSIIKDARLPDPVLRQEFPEFYTHPRYYDILKQVGLDDEAVAKLIIPPLPFSH